MLKHHCVRSVTSPVPSRVDPANGPSSATDTPISLLVRPSSATVTALIRANPSPEVTDPATRLPLPTLVYRLEAVHLGDLLRLSVRTDAKIARLSLRFSRAHLSAPDTAKAAVLYWAAVPISGRTDSRTRAPYKEKSTLSGAHTHVNDFACVAAPGEHFPVRGNVNPIPFRYAGAARDAQNPAATPATVRSTNLGRTRGPNLVTAVSKQSGPGRRAVTTKPGPHFRTSTRGGSTRTRARGFGARRGGPPARRGLARPERTAATAGIAYGPPPGFPLASHCSGIVHHLLAGTNRARSTATVTDRAVEIGRWCARAAETAGIPPRTYGRPFAFIAASGFVQQPLSRAGVRLLVRVSRRVLVG
ncbi:Hypp9386 [Branchiostoma lanceolatum]|uniref:Hypp9386 protein n=1 Tax=Branchiostoma lanceolatum TaxID=7740 RepID=A0A8S4MLM0_BRALA|nr:Hypp9386 [Branchiostoma lanceolatum]